MESPEDLVMPEKPTYKELELRVKELEKASIEEKTLARAHLESQERLEQRLTEMRLSLIDYAAGHSLDELLTRALDEVGVFVDSPIGFYHFVEPDQKTLSLQQWSTRTLKEFCRAKGKGTHYSIDQAGVWVDCVLVKEPVIHNDYASLPHKKGMPEGHAEVIRELVVPVMRKGKVVAILGVGNKPTDYMEKDVEIVSYLADVTWEIVRQKRTEEALGESEKRHRTILFTAMDGFVMTDLQGNIRDVNDAFCRMNGYSSQELLTMNISDLEAAITPAEVAAKFQYIVAHGEGRFESRHRRKDGTIFEVEVSVQYRPAEGDLMAAFLRDITKRKRSGEALRKSEELYRLLVDNFEGAIHSYDKDGNILFMNERAAQNLDLTPEHAIGKPLTDIMPGEGDLLIERNREIIDSGIGKTYEDTFDLSDGKVWMWSNAQPVRDTEGKPYAVQIMSYDITERKRAEEKLLQSEKDLKEAQRIARIGSFTWDLLENTNEWSDELLEMFEVEKDGLESVDWFMGTIIHPDDRAGVRAAHRRTMYEKVFHPVEFRIVTPGGTEKIVNVEGEVTCESGKVIAISGAIQDITERKQVEEDLKESRQDLQTMFDTLDDFLFILDLEGRIIQVNPVVQKRLGYSPEKLIGKSVLEVHSPDRREEAKAIVSDMIIGKISVYSLPLVSTDGSEIQVETKISFGRWRGKDALFGLSRDITERKRTQAIILQTEKMLSVGGLAAGMAHEINNPLAGIIQNAQVLKTRMSHGLQKNRHVAEECGTTIETIEAYMDRRDLISMIDLIMESGKRAAKIVGNMLSFSRKSDAQFAKHDLGELLDKTVELSESDYDLKKKYDFRKIEIIREYDAAMPEVMCEENTLQQVFFNILENGAQVMTEDRLWNEEEGLVPRFTLRVMQDGDLARVEIADNGPGMDEATRKRVFEPFYTTKPVGMGTGLGMSVSYFIITENHGGNITVESKPGKGTTFILLLPIERKEQTTEIR